MSQRKDSAGQGSSGDQSMAVLAAFVTAASLAFPFMAASALLTWSAARSRRAPWAWMIAGLAVCGWFVRAGAEYLAPFALLRCVLPHTALTLLHLSPAAWGDAITSGLVEAFAGPLFLAIVVATHHALTSGSLRYQHDVRAAASSRLERMVVKPSRALARRDTRHPLDHIRLGRQLANGRPVDVNIDDLRLGVALIGQPGMGKSRALLNIIDGLRRSHASRPFFLLVIEPKADEGFRDELRHVASDADLPWYELSDSATSMTYDPIGSSDAAVVVHKLLATMDFVVNAAIYREIAGHVLALLVAALREVGDAVTFSTICDSLATDKMLALAGRSTSVALKQLASGLASKQRTLEGEAINGLRHRLSRVLLSTYGRVLVEDPMRLTIRLDEVSKCPGILYVATSVHGGGDDARLLLNILLTDIGEVAHKRNSAIARGEQVWPIYVVLDEFAQLARGGSLGESQAIEHRLSNLFELCCSSRVALMPAMQVLPATEELVSDLFAAGVMIVFRTSQADDIAKRLGTVPGSTITHQLDEAGAASGAGTLTAEPQFAVKPDLLRRSAPGVVSIRVGNAVPVFALLTDTSTARDSRSTPQRRVLDFIARTLRLRPGDAS
jgi:hypothetical protein